MKIVEQNLPLTSLPSWVKDAFKTSVVGVATFLESKPKVVVSSQLGDYRGKYRQKVFRVCVPGSRVKELVLTHVHGGATHVQSRELDEVYCVTRSPRYRVAHYYRRKPKADAQAILRAKEGLVG